MALLGLDGSGSGVRGNRSIDMDGGFTLGDRTLTHGMPLPATQLPIAAQELPPLSKFTGECLWKGETIVEWLEQLELVASAYHWDESTKLVNLVTHLKHQEFALPIMQHPEKEPAHNTRGRAEEMLYTCAYLE